jgi:hypothetical protein
MSCLGLLTRAASALALLIGLSGSFATTSVQAQTIEDPLHGCVNAVVGCPEPVQGNLSPGLGNTFEFVSSPSGDVGTLYLEILVPVSDANANMQSYTVSGGANSPASSTLLSGQFTNAAGSNLATFLGIQNNLGTGSPTMTNSSLGGVNYYVYQVNLGNETLGGTSNPSATTPSPFSFTAGDFLPGTVIVAYLASSNCTTKCDITTATSGQIDVTPLPAALSLFAGGLGLIGFAGFRKRRKTARLAAA